MDTKLKNTWIYTLKKVEGDRHEITHLYCGQSPKIVLPRNNW